MVRFFVALLLALTLLPGVALADRILARVSISTQTMKVYHEGRHIYTWPVSTARPGKVTPTGVYAPEFLSRNHRSSRYNNAPMPFAIFYDGHYAIHGTDQIRRLGRPASAGCVRLHPGNAKILFDMVKWEGLENMKVMIAQ
ncbi:MULTISPECIES: L,D-transpeptidase [Tabrizicola]|uniref:L,D-transpeptidase n=1 Tax=Tabrizicola TaxID=1443919 RepID=UPI001081A855|nr:MULTISPECIES: L,D-transpeptidase [Paracoccaceae]